MADDNSESSAMMSPCQAGDLKKGSIAMFKGRPAKVMEIRVSKTGKHGHAKCSITAIDVFNGKKYQDVQPSHAAMFFANCDRKEYQLVHIDKDADEAQVMNDDGDILTFALGESEEAVKLKEEYTEDAVDDFFVTVLSGPAETSPGVFVKKEMIVSYKTQPAVKS